MAFLAVALVAGGHSAARANVFATDGQDPRVAQPRNGPDRQYAPIGTLTTVEAVPASEDGRKRIRTRGTAFLVSPCYILSNYHAVFGLAYDGPEQGRDYTAVFAVGADPDYPFHWEERAKPVRWGSFNRRKEHDWALLKLDGCVGGQPDVGWLELQPEAGKALLGQPVSLAGYPSDKADTSLWAQSACRIEAMQDGTDKVLHGCAVHAGASGAPLISLSSGVPAAVAIQCGELNSTKGPIDRYEARYANTAVTVAEVYRDAEVRRLIEADRAAFPSGNPAMESTTAVAVPTLTKQLTGLH